MNELGLALPFWLMALIWMAKTIWLALVCTILAWLGVRALDALTPHIPHPLRKGGAIFEIFQCLATKQ